MKNEVRVTHGANDGTFAIAGMAVGNVRRKLRTAYNIPDDAVALVSGVRVEEGHMLRAGEHLIFSKCKGMKGALEPEEMALLKRIEMKLDQLSEREEAEYLTIKQAATLTASSCTHIRRAVIAGELPASNIGSPRHAVYRIARSDLADWMSRKKGGAAKLSPKSELDDLIERHLPGLRGRKDSATR